MAVHALKVDKLLRCIEHGRSFLLIFYGKLAVCVLLAILLIDINILYELTAFLDNYNQAMQTYQ